MNSITYLKHPITGDIKVLKGKFNYNAFLFGAIYLFATGDSKNGTILFLLTFIPFFILTITSSMPLLGIIWSLGVLLINAKDYNEVRKGDLLKEGYQEIK